MTKRRPRTISLRSFLLPENKPGNADFRRFLSLLWSVLEDLKILLRNITKRLKFFGFFSCKYRKLTVKYIHVVQKGNKVLFGGGKWSNPTFKKYKTGVLSG